MDNKKKKPQLNKAIPVELPVKPANGGQMIKKILHKIILEVENLPMQTEIKLGKEFTGYCKAISDVITVLENNSRLSV